MSFIGLLIVSAGAAFAVVWLLQYAPLISKKPKTIWLRKNPETNKFAILPIVKYIEYSPRLFFCKLLIPFDIGITLFLVFAGMLGLSTAVTGISMMIFNVMTAIGWSVGVFLVHKFFKPRWEKQYKKLLTG